MSGTKKLGRQDGSGKKAAARKSRSRLANGAAAVAVLGAGIGLAASPAQAEVGYGDILSGAESAYTMYKECESNEDHGLDCFKDQQETVNDIYVMTKDLTATVAKNHEQVMASFDAVIARLNNSINQGNNAALKAQYESLRADLDTAHTGAVIYEALISCMSAAANAPAGETGVCETVDKFGTSQGIVNADGTAMTTLKNALLANEVKDQARGVSGWTLSPTDVMQRIGGSDKNAFKSDGMLNANMIKIKGETLTKQGADAASKIAFFPASFVNELDQSTRAILDEERQYFTVRAAAAGLRDTPEGDADAKSYQNLALKGRGGEYPLFSIEDQYKVFTFGASIKEPESGKLAPNEAYVVGPKGTFRIAVLNASDGASHGSNLPTQSQLRELNDAWLSTGTNYTRLSAEYPDAMPRVQAAGDQAMARCHTPQTSDKGMSGAWFTKAGGDILRTGKSEPFGIYDGKIVLPDQYANNTEVGCHEGEGAETVEALAGGKTTAPLWRQYPYGYGQQIAGTMTYRAASVQILPATTRGPLQPLDEQ